MTNSVQGFIRTTVWLVSVTVFMLLGWMFFSGVIRTGIEAFSGDFQINPAISNGVILIILFIVSSIVASIIAAMFYILPEWERVVVLRMGKFSSVKGPGAFIIWPFIYSAESAVDMRVITYEIPSTTTLTKDNVPVGVEAVVELKVENAMLATLKVANYQKTVVFAAIEALKTIIGSYELRDLLAERDAIGKTLREDIDEEVERFGVDIPAVRITDINTPQELIEELAVIARAERGAKAKQINSEAELQVAKDLAEAARLLNNQPGALQLRHMQVLLDISKEEGNTIIIYPDNSPDARTIAAAAAGNQT